MYYNLKIINVFYVCIFISLTNSQQCKEDKECQELFKCEYAFCDLSHEHHGESKCQCGDFFGLDNSMAPEFRCVKGVPHGKMCSQDLECTTILGIGMSRCNPDAKKCECYDEAGKHMEVVNGNCVGVKKLGEACGNNNECILGSNEFARCVKHKCGCHSSDIASFVADKTGKCILKSNGGGHHDEHAEHDTETNNTLAVVAVTVSLAVAIMAIVALLYIATRPKPIDPNAQPSTCCNPPPQIILKSAAV